jgi:hypothetical protein
MAKLSLMAVLGIDGKGFARGLTTAQAQARQAGRNMQNALTGFAMRAIGVGAITQAARSTMDFAERMVDLRSRTGLAVEELQKLEYAAKKGGSSLEKVIQVQERLGVAMTEAMSGRNQPALESLQRLGLTMEQIAAGDVHKSFLQISSEISKAGNSAALFNDIQKTMGRGAAEILPAMREGFAEMGQKLEEMNGVMSTDQIDKLNVAAKEFKDIWMRMRPVVGEVLSFISDRVSQVWDMLQIVTKGIGGFIGGFLGDSGNLQSKLMAALREFETEVDSVVDARIARDAKKNKNATRARYGDELDQATHTYEQIEKLKEKLAKKEFDLMLSGLTTAEKLLELEKKRLALREKQGPLTEGEDLEVRLAELDIDSQLAKLRKEKSKAASSSALDINQLQRIGAFTSGTQGVDRQILNTAQVQERHLGKLVAKSEATVKALTEIKGKLPNATRERGVTF